MADEVFPGHGPEDLTQDNGSSSPTSSSASSSRRPSRNPSFYNAASWFNEDSEFTPLDKLSVFDLFDNLDLQQQLERLNRSLNLKKHREKVKEQYVKQKERVMKKRNEELERYKQKYGQALDKVMDKWSDTTVSIGSSIQVLLSFY